MWTQGKYASDRKPRVDYTGKSFGRWTVGEFIRRGEDGVPWYSAACSCGTVRDVKISTLVKGASKSCGCVWAEKCIARSTHGATRGGNSTAEHSSWTSMHKRCYDTNAVGYQHYGGRGVYICTRWKRDFSAFLSDMGQRPKGMTIDRIDVNGSYTCGKCDDCIAKGAPMNCRWATHKQQGRNKRDNVLLTINGETRCIAEWVEQYGLSRVAFSARVARGETPEQALSRPVRARKLRANPKEIAPRDGTQE